MHKKFSAFGINYLVIIAFATFAPFSTGCSAVLNWDRPECGNGIVEGNELCDDGNTEGGDGCSANCLSDETCGNGTVDASTNEICDDGNNENGDGCSANCRSDETCGNGVLDGGEQCDDGANNGTPASPCRSDCSLGACGNDIIDQAEQCDGFNLDGQTCSTLPGFTHGTLACQQTCQFDTSACTTCGDGVCDEGNGEDISICPADCGLIDIAAGDVIIGSNNWDYTCGLRGDGTVWCWGSNERGQQGTGQPLVDSNLVPTLVPGLTGVTKIVGGFAHVCALKNDGTVWCWGDDTEGACGDGSAASDTTVPVQVSTLTGVVDITAGGQHACAQLGSGAIYCWGRGVSGQLADGFNEQRDAPVIVSGTVSDPIALSGGGAHMCVLESSGTARCSGANSGGQLGNGDTTPTNTFSWSCCGFAGLAAISAGLNHTCGILTNSTVVCVGLTSWGQLGDNSTDPGTNPAVVPVGLGTVTAIHAGQTITCAAKTDGTAMCWGDNTGGQLGDNSKDPSLVPVPVQGLTNVVKFATGTFHTCALLNDGTARCWGQNGRGQLGNNSRLESLVPVAVVGFGG